MNFTIGNYNPEVYMLIDFPIDAWVWCIKDPLIVSAFKKKKKKTDPRVLGRPNLHQTSYMFTTNETLCYLCVLHLPESWLGIGNYNGKYE